MLLLREFLKNNYRYIRVFFITAILFPFLDYFIGGERILALLIIEGIIFSAIMTFFIRTYCGPDTGNMFFELVDNFDSNKSCKEILQILTEVVQAKKGKILSCSENSFKAKFGNKIMSMLFGASIGSIYFKNTSPIKIEINIEPIENKNHIVMHFFDNELKFVIRHTLGQSVFNQYCMEFLKEIKEKLK